jgi:hypothetical protein
VAFTDYNYTLDDYRFHATGLYDVIAECNGLTSAANIALNMLLMMTGTVGVVPGRMEAGFVVDVATALGADAVATKLAVVQRAFPAREGADIANGFRRYCSPLGEPMYPAAAPCMPLRAHVTTNKFVF